ncbi:type II toxin-antitoxin system HigB family toxin [Ensifer sp. Root231]
MTEWYATVSKASWSNFSELKKTFNSADIVAGNMKPTTTQSRQRARLT